MDFAAGSAITNIVVARKPWPRLTNAIFVFYQGAELPLRSRAAHVGTWSGAAQPLLPACSSDLPAHRMGAGRTALARHVWPGLPMIASRQEWQFASGSRQGQEVQGISQLHRTPDPP